MYKILIVDDQYGIRVLLKEILQKDGHKVLEAANGIQALDLLEAEHPDLMLLDIKIPGMDGVEILKERMNRQISLDTQVILMTAYGELNMMKEAKEHGASSHISKPFDIDEVRKEIQHHIS